MGVRKKSIAVLLSLLLMASINITAYAQTVQGLVTITPFWSNADDISVCLSFSNGKGSPDGSVIGKTGTTSITGKAVLERHNTDGTYTKVASWDNLAEIGSMLFFSETYYVARGYTYRLTLTATVYRNGSAETVSVSKTIVES